MYTVGKVVSLCISILVLLNIILECTEDVNTIMFYPNIY